MIEVNPTPFQEINLKGYTLKSPTNPLRLQITSF